MVTRVLLVRHGQSTWNAEQRWQGQADPPLSEWGREQARRAATALTDLFPEISSAVSSPQLRAIETARLLTEHARIAPDPADIVHLPDLRERRVGPWSGLTRTEIEAQFPGYLEQGRRPDGYEPDDAVFVRAERALLATARDNGASTILIVCHGGVIVTLMQRLTGERNRVPNLSGWTAEIREERIVMGERFDLLPAEERTGGDAVRF